MSGPLKPSEVQQKKNASIPEEVFEVFNSLIVEKWSESSREAVIHQCEAAERVATALKITKGEVYDRKLLDVESTYRQAGWKVEYDKPAYNETYEPTFRFRKK